MDFPISFWIFGLLRCGVGWDEDGGFPFSSLVFFLLTRFVGLDSPSLHRVNRTLFAAGHFCHLEWAVEGPGEQNVDC